jgi:hypothetical protein
MDDSRDAIMSALKERAKELNCLYRVDEILGQSDLPDEEIYNRLIRILPAGWQYPEICRTMISFVDGTRIPTDFEPTPWQMTADIIVMGEKIGEVTVCYTKEMPRADEGSFLREERRLISAVAERIGLHIMQQGLRRDHESWESAIRGINASERKPWEVLLEFLHRTDQNLLARITRKMINHLCWNGIAEAEALLRESLADLDGAPVTGEDNRPRPKRKLRDIARLTRKTFNVAARNLSEREVVSSIESWINEEKSTFLIKSLESPGTGLAETTEAVERFQNADIDDAKLPVAVQTSLKVALLRRFFVDQLAYINLAKNFVNVRDFYPIVTNLVHPDRSQGKLGGKGAGLFLASQVIQKSAEGNEKLRDIRTPKTWYVASDAPLEFIHYNNLDEVYNHKYMEIERIRQDYPHIVQVFKNSSFPPELTKGLAAALDDFEDSPIIVRSSSLLEDQVGAAFSGKYKSLFLANQGSKKERLEALQDAIAEVYASVFSPDPIEYRAERGLLDFREEMGILIQEVVGRRIGKYYFPAFAGVAFSNNEFRWSTRIRRDDGLVRMVPGLGTRAVDRLTDDYPVLVSPGQPGLRVNVSIDEILRYSPHKIDVINLETNDFETVEVGELLRECGDSYPAVRQIVSIVERDHVRTPRGLEPDWEQDEFVVTFEGLFRDTPFVERMGAVLQTLRDKLQMPVDVEFASDGEHLYVVQCRSQSHTLHERPAAIPREIPRDQLLFSAKRYVSNGQVPDITHIVYVDPDAYAEIDNLDDLRAVGRVVGKLNSILPRRQFVLMGPGRWGSRGDVKLGVSATYSDINNTCLLVEIARQKGNYVPELSFGTHFFQDLVEAEIRYLPLYPDSTDNAFNDHFFASANNILPQLVPEAEHLAHVVRVIDVPAEADGKILRVLMNAELEEAVGMLAMPSGVEDYLETESEKRSEGKSENHWRWRLHMAEQLAASLDGEKFGVKGVYLFGSTKNANAGPGSDINLILHLDGENHIRPQLSHWMHGWSLALAEINYLRTGRKSDGLLDVHYVTDSDIARQTSFASKIGAVTDAARPLTMKKSDE